MAQPFNKQNHKMSNKILWALMLLIVFATDTIVFNTNSNTSVPKISHYIVVFVAILMFFFCYIIQNRKMSLFYLVALFSIIIYIILYLVRSDGELNLNNYIFYIALILFGVSFSSVYSINDFCEKYVKILRVVAIISLIGYAFGSLIVDISFIPSIENSAGNTFKTLIFTNIPLYSQSRNWGPFWEPGAYQAFLNFALIFSLFVVEKHRLFNALLFMVTSITTMSGAVLIPLALIIIAYMASNSKCYKANVNKKSTIAIVLLFAIVCCFCFGWFDSILEKLSGDSQSNSLQFRLISLLTSIVAFIRNPLLGCSVETQRAIALEISQKYFNCTYVYSINTYPALFGTFGFVIGIVYLVGTWKFIRGFSNKLISLILIIAVIFMTMNENFTSSLLISVIAFLRNKDESHITYSSRWEINNNQTNLRGVK